MKKLVENETILREFSQGGKNYKICYGNIVFDKDDEETTFTLPQEQYEQVLHDFLKSKEGREYTEEDTNSPSGLEHASEQEEINTEQTTKTVLEDKNQEKSSKDLQNQSDDSSSTASSDKKHRNPFEESTEQTTKTESSDNEASEDKEELSKLEQEQKRREERKQRKLEAKKRKQEERERKEAEERARNEEAKRLEQEKQEKERLAKEKRTAVENTQNIDIDESLMDADNEEDARPNHYTLFISIMTGLTVASILVTIFAFLCLYGKIPNMNPATSKNNIQVLQFTRDIAQGEVITEDAVTSVAIPNDEYSSLSDGTYIKADGTTSNDIVVLYDNIADVVGKYATGNIASGEYVMSSEYSELAENETYITMNVDGTETKIPVNVTTAGKSSVNMYAIITTTTSDGTTKNYAMNIGTFKLEGRTLEDILNSDGKSVLNELLEQQKDDGAEETKSETEATPESEADSANEG